MSIEQRHLPLFYLTPPGPCPYLPDQQERKIFTHLIGSKADFINDQLTHEGFRRSQNIAYKPACETCKACVSVRIHVDEFVPTRSLKRITVKNQDVTARMITPKATLELYSLFRDYIDGRHAEGGMADMTALDFAFMVEDSFIDTRLIEYRRKPTGHDRHPGELIGAVLCDVLSDGLSMVYSFFTPDLAGRSLGTYMILEHVERTRKLGLPYLYLGYWVRGSQKMNYKKRFQPLEHLGEYGWERGITTA